MTNPLITARNRHFECFLRTSRKIRHQATLVQGLVCSLRSSAWGALTEPNCLRHLDRDHPRSRRTEMKRRRPPGAWSIPVSSVEIQHGAIRWCRVCDGQRRTLHVPGHRGCQMELGPG